MQIVINIPEEIYQEAIKSGYSHLYDEEVANAVANGTPLPKGHGRLIDADYLKDVILLHSFHGSNKNIVPYPDRRGYRLRQREVDEGIINAPTIIEEEKCR